MFEALAEPRRPCWWASSLASRSHVDMDSTANGSELTSTLIDSTTSFMFITKGKSGSGIKR
eukprot:scaffold5950_cov263-Amphora_coffeaeformis.AAC.1